MLIFGNEWTANKFARVVFHPPVETRGLPHFLEVLGEDFSPHLSQWNNSSPVNPPDVTGDELWPNLY